MKILWDALALRVLLHLYKWCQWNLHIQDPHARHFITQLGMRIEMMLR